jgi:hypothetical protein
MKKSIKVAPSLALSLVFALVFGARPVSIHSAPVTAPSLVYSGYLGGSGSEDATALAVDDTGALYLVGSTSSADFPATSGAFDASLSEMDAFVARLSPDGTRLESATLLGGSGMESGWGIAVEDGLVYVSGETWSPDFPVTADAYDATCGSDGACNAGGQGPYPDAFLAILSGDLSQLIYSTYLGGKDSDQAYALAVEAGSAYLAGTTYSSDFPSGGYRRNGDAFVARFDSRGTLTYSTLLGGSDVDAAFAIAVRGGKAYLAGETSSPDISAQDAYAGGREVLFSRLNEQGGIEFTRLAGGAGDEQGFAISLLPGGEAYLAGATSSSGFPKAQGNYAGAGDGLLLRFSPAGEPELALLLGGSGMDELRGVHAAGDGRVIVAGNTASTDFPPVGSAFQPQPGGNKDVFVMSLNTSGNTPQIEAASYLGGAGQDSSLALSVAQGYVYLAGFTESSDFPATRGALATALQGPQDAFYAKIDLALPPTQPAASPTAAASPTLRPPVTPNAPATAPAGATLSPTQAPPIPATVISPVETALTAAASPITAPSPEAVILSATPRQVPQATPGAAATLAAAAPITGNPPPAATEANTAQAAAATPPAGEPPGGSTPAATSVVSIPATETRTASSPRTSAGSRLWPWAVFILVLAGLAAWWIRQRGAPGDHQP